MSIVKKLPAVLMAAVGISFSFAGTALAETILLAEKTLGPQEILDLRPNAPSLSLNSVGYAVANAPYWTKLIAQMDLGSILRKMPNSYGYTSKFEEAWKQSDRKQRLLSFCNSAPLDMDARFCYSVLKLWLMDKQMKYYDSGMRPSDPGFDGNDARDLLTAQPPVK